jgi:NAD(P)-dependent dehydrogenase (short-subunit alcohol dehydrogenase family)
MTDCLRPLALVTGAFSGIGLELARQSVREWLPVLANALGAKPPRRAPRWMARLFAGEAAVMMGTQSRGASSSQGTGSS